MTNSLDASRRHVAQIERDGYTVVENCLPREFVARVHSEFMRLMNEKVTRFGLAQVRPDDGRDVLNANVQRDFRPEGGNHDLNRWNMHLPTSDLFMSELLVAQPDVLAVLDTFLGPDCVAFLMASDTPYPGAGFQSIHQDYHRFGFTVNIPLVDFDPDMAPLEVWPGSHLRKKSFGSRRFHKNSVWLSKKDLDEVVAATRSVKVPIHAGSMLIRDHRLVHRGTANRTDRPRPWLSIWYKNIDRLDPMGLTIPVPHRSICDVLARRALEMRRRAMGSGTHIVNRELLNLGNLGGRLVEEFAASDRDYRRVVPRDLWDSLSPRMRRLLRYASVEGDSRLGDPVRSWVGSGIVSLIGLGFAGAGLYLDRHARCRAKGPQRESTEHIAVTPRARRSISHE